MTAPGDPRPCAGLTVVEVAVGTSELGLGLAGGVPGMILADLGASVVRVVGSQAAPIDRQVTWGRAWHRDKQTVVTDDAAEVAARLGDADVALVYGPPSRVEARGLGYGDVCATNPGLVYARCRPSWNATGTMDDYALLVEARSGFCTQLAGHRPGPIFLDYPATGGGTAFLLTTSVLALLGQRAATGRGGWSETSLYDGMLTTLGCMVGRSERAPVEVESYWEHGSTFPNFLYRCADDELIQVWFGGKGMYAALIDVLGDEPSKEGYYSDQTNGLLNARAVRWRETFATRPRDAWIPLLRDAGVACEPVLAPGQVLPDPHAAANGLALARTDGSHHDLVVGSPISVGPLTDVPVPADAPTVAPTDAPTDVVVGSDPVGDRLLAGVRVLDFSAFVAGPLAAQVLADLGADVIKVEPPEGEAMRAAAYAVAACQRGKRSLAMDINAPSARPVVERLIQWADVVLHNFRVGVSERLGIDEETVARLNPQAVYCHASAFGTTGPRARFPGNDALMQALTGLERAAGGQGNDPTSPSWIPIDMSGGWVAAAGVLAGLYARATRGQGQRVATSLLGAGMLLQSGVYQRDGACVRGPALDGDQTGYGPGYRIYQAGDDQWLAVVIADQDAWAAIGAQPEASALPHDYVPLRGGADDTVARTAETALEAAFATAPAATWVHRLRQLGALAEVIGATSRDGFRQGILDDPVNRQLGRVASYRTADWGHFEQIGRLARCGPGAGAGSDLMLPGHRRAQRRRAHRARLRARRDRRPARRQDRPPALAGRIQGGQQSGRVLLEHPDLGHQPIGDRHELDHVDRLGAPGRLGRPGLGGDLHHGRAAAQDAGVDDRAIPVLGEGGPHGRHAVGPVVPAAVGQRRGLLDAEGGVEQGHGAGQVAGRVAPGQLGHDLDGIGGAGRIAHPPTRSRAQATNVGASRGQRANSPSPWAWTAWRSIHSVSPQGGSTSWASGSSCASCSRGLAGVVGVAHPAAEHQGGDLEAAPVGVVEAGDELVAAGAVGQHPALHGGDERLGVEVEEPLAVGRVALEHLLPLVERHDRLHAAVPGGHDRAPAVVVPEGDEPDRTAADPPHGHARRDVAVARGGEQGDPGATRATGDHGRGHVEMAQQAGQGVGLHGRLGGPGEAHVGLTGVGPVPDEDLVAVLRQGLGQLPHPGIVLAEPAAGGDGPGAPLADHLVRERQPVDLCRCHGPRL